MPGTWKFSPSWGGSKRLEDGVWFDFEGNPISDPNLGQAPDWVWVVYWPEKGRRTRLDPHTLDLHSVADVEAYIDNKWPLPGQESLL